jgi:hypothetical protein
MKKDGDEGGGTLCQRGFRPVLQWDLNPTREGNHVVPPAFAVEAAARHTTRGVESLLYLTELPPAGGRDSNRPRQNPDCDGSDAAPAADKNKTMNNANRDKSDGTFFPALPD